MLLVYLVRGRLLPEMAAGLGGEIRIANTDFTRVSEKSSALRQNDMGTTVGEAACPFRALI